MLRREVKIEDRVPVNVLSAARAKGLEFARVAVYGFGQSGDADFIERTLEGEIGEPDGLLQHEYFFNALYVAVSRPKRRLFIVDDRSAITKFWRFATDERTQREIVEELRAKDKAWSDVVIGGMIQGNANDLSTDRTVDPEENARNFQDLGKARRDANLLRQAAVAYRNAGRTDKSRECRAWAALYDDEFVEAGREFLQVGEIDLAVEALWRGGSRGREVLLAAIGDTPEIAKTIQYSFASFLANRPVVETGLQVLEELASRLESAEFALRARSEAGWIDAVTDVLKRLRSGAAPGDSRLSMERLAALCERLRARGFPVDSSEEAHVHFHGGRFARAVQLWDLSGQAGSREYKEAVAQITPFPGKIKPLADLGKHQEIVDAIDGHRETVLTGELAMIAGQSCMVVRRFEEALQLFVRARAVKELVSLATEAIRAKPSEDVARRAMCASLILQTAIGDWHHVLRYVREGVGAVIAGPALAASGEWAKQQRAVLDVALTRALARADSLADLPWEDRRTGISQRPIAEYMKKLYVQSEITTWARRVSAMEVGGAIERSGSRVDSLAFYENIRSAVERSEIKRFAQERWIVAKERQARFEIDQGRDRNAETQWRDAKAERMALGLGDTVLPEYPIVGSVDDLLVEIATDREWPAAATGRREEHIAGKEDSPSTEASPPAVSPDHAGGVWSVNDLAFRSFPASGRINIQHQRNGETAVIRTRERRCESADVQFREREDGWFECPSWHIAIQFPGAPSALVIRCLNVGLTLSLDA